MSDRWAVALAIAAAVGASRPSSTPLVLAVLAVGVALSSRRPVLLCLAVAVLASTLAGRSLAGLDDVEPGRVAATVRLLSDPAPSVAGLRADARLGARHVELRAQGASAAALAPRLAGETVTVRGELQPVPPGADWLVARHVAARLRVFVVESWEPGPLPARLANALRRTLVAGAAPLTAVQRSLYTGLVIGDDREQPVELADDFLGAGLTHLLAVSGQNVAFVLSLAGPLLRRLRLWPRLGATLLAIALFGVTTRFEPSVLRASAMAALAVLVTTLGTPVSRLRILALAITGLVLIDPLLVRSVGFRLSVGAAAAIVVVAPRLAEALPGPAVLREPLAVTLAAQLGVAPVLLASFGPLPVASLPANLLAVPAAGPVMVWGLTGGLVAGAVGGPVAELVHVPTRLLLGWLAEVAQRMARMPLGHLSAAHVAALAAGLGAAAWSKASPAVRRGGLGLAAAAVSAAVLAAQAPVPLRTALGPGIVRWHAGGTEVIVLGGAGGRSPLHAPAVLAALREAGVGAVDVVVVADASVPAGAVAAVRRRHPIGGELTVADVPSHTRLLVGQLEVHLTVASGRLVVEARPA